MLITRTGSDYAVRIEGTTIDGATVNAFSGQPAGRRGRAARARATGRLVGVVVQGIARASVINGEAAFSYN